MGLSQKGLSIRVQSRLHPCPKEQQQDRHPFNSLFSRTTWVSQNQKGKTIVDSNEATDDRVAVASAGPYANHLHHTPDR